jgi:streptomycin 6-kinase
MDLFKQEDTDRSVGHVFSISCWSSADLGEPYHRGVTDGFDATVFDLSSAKSLALKSAAQWGLTLEAPFAMSSVSYAAPAGSVVVKVPWGGDDESLHEAEALRLWDGHGAVQLLDQLGPAILEERAVPGDDLAAVPDAAATRIALDIARQIWVAGRPPFRPVVPEVRKWLHEAELAGSDLVPLARELLSTLGEPIDWVVHGDFHHHNLVRHGERYVAIDPKPYLCEREFDVPSFLWNPKDNVLDNRQQTDDRIAAFVAAGLSEWRIRAWTVVRGAYLRPAMASRIRALLDG